MLGSESPSTECKKYNIGCTLKYTYVIQQYLAFLVRIPKQVFQEENRIFFYNFRNVIRPGLFFHFGLVPTEIIELIVRVNAAYWAW